MLRRIVLIVTLTSVLGSAQAGVVDQSQEVFDTSLFVISPDWRIAQTFTAGMSGKLEKVDLHLTNVFDSELYPSTVSIVNVNGGVPDGALLGEAFTGPLAAGVNSIDFSSDSIYLTSGVQYGIVMTNDDPAHYFGPSTQWRSTSTDVYAGGSVWSFSSTTGWVQSYEPEDPLFPIETYFDKDTVFTTHMAVPAPSSLLLVSCGSLLLLRKRRG